MSNKLAHNFLNLTGTDHLGRTAQDYLKFTNDDWEACHNHVQWAFPSHIASAYNPDAPVLSSTKEFVQEMSVLEMLTVKNLVIAYMESLDIVIIGTNVCQTFKRDSYGEPYPLEWVTPSNHNYLRLTRVLNLLYYVDSEWCEGLYRVLLHNAKYNPDAISRETLLYWGKASIGSI